jgi:iron only hydrogenase large subunit-like protein
MFSSAIVLDDLNDFISPSQECIKPIPSTKTQSKADVKVSDEGRYYEVQKDGTEQALEEAKISLNDCLACSGCVTSAETVLIAMQHGDELLKALSNRNGRCFVVSLSSQSRASLASKWGMNSMQVCQKK